MDNYDAKKLPPPPGRDTKKLHLKASMTRKMVAQSSSSVEKMKSSVKERSATPSTGAMERMEERLLELQVKMINDKELLKEREQALEAKEHALNEKESLVEARAQVVESRYNSMPDKATDAVSQEEREALEALRTELDRREQSLKETEVLQHERETYLEECENEMLHRAHKLTEREAQIEQREEGFFRQAGDSNSD